MPPHDAPSDPVVVPFPTQLVDPIRLQFRNKTVDLSPEAVELVRAIAYKTGADELLVIDRLLVHFGHALRAEDPEAFGLAIPRPEDSGPRS